MSHVNVEIKARCDDPDRVRAFLEGRHADFRGTDQQCDTYFCVPNGRLKLREGVIENALIFYDRPDQTSAKPSRVSLSPVAPDSRLKQVLGAALETLVVVRKEREIYFLGNVKFHIDQVEGLGSFVEIEAIDEDGDIGLDRLLSQCEQYMTLLGIEEADLIECSYSDMFLNTGL